MPKKKYYLFKIKELELNVVSIILLVLMFLITISLQIPIDFNDKSFISCFPESSKRYYYMQHHIV